MATETSISNAEMLNSYVGMVQEKLPTTQQVIDSPFSTFLLFTLALWLLRVVILKTLVYIGRTPYADTYRITKRPGITDKQLEREAIWVYGYGYDTVALAFIYWSGMLNNLSLFDFRGFFWMLVWHAVIVEPIYYAFHRLLHWSYFYKNFHQYHHKSINTEPTTGVSFEFVERISYTILFAVAPLVTDLQGYQSYAGFFLYYVWFDIMNEGGHINFEVLPQWWLNSPMRFVFYSPTFHSVHHTKFKKNYSLFMPYTDILFGTAVYSDDKNSPLLPLTNPQSAKGLDFMLLVHPSNLESTLYSIKLHPWIAPLLGFTHKHEHKIWMYLFQPYLWIAGIYVSVLDRIGYHYEEEFPFSMEHTTNSSNSDNEYVPVKRKFDGGTWIIRNYGFQYILPSFKNLIKDRIERAILDAQSKNVRVVGLGNFNKAEWMNHGGSDIVEKYKDKLNGTWISHGDTLSAAVVFQYAMRLREEGYWNKSVFITGSTSKIGRAVVLSLAKQQIRVVMYTQVKERFDEIAAEAGDNKSFLVYATSLSEGKSCDLWLTGKMLPRGKELMDAIPLDATVVNFSVPDPLSSKLLKSRPDILHLDTGLLAYDRNHMAPKFTWLLPNGVIYACLGGSIVHSILGINAHEVGAVVVNDMEKYWNAALSLGFKIPPPSSFHNRIVMPPPKNRTVTIV